MLIKILGLLALFFYFIALVLGLILYLSADRRDLMTAGEVIGYATITKPEAEEIQKLLDLEAELSHKVEQAQSDLIDKQAQRDRLLTQIDQLQQEIDTLTAAKQPYEKGQALATDLLAMKPQQAAATLTGSDQTQPDDEFLKFFVRYALPFMRTDAKYQKFIDAIAKGNPILTAQIEMLVAKEEQGVAQ